LPQNDNPAPAEWIRRNAGVLFLAFALIFIVVPRISPFEPLNEYLTVFSRFSEWLLRRLQELFRDYGYYVVFFGVLAENTLLLGLLVPGAIILILAGLSAQNGDISLPIVLALAVLATIIGDTLSYVIGRLGWTKAIQRGAMADMLERVRGTMESNQTWIILAYHFAGYSRVIGPTAAGIFRLRFRRWAPLDYAGAALWVLAYTLGGVLLGVFGVDFDDTKRMVRILELAILGALIIAVVVAFARAARQQASGGDGAGGTGAGGGRPSTVVIPVEDK
jgi:membrane protein DedA with SNARE-associated domain